MERGQAQDDELSLGGAQVGVLCASPRGTSGTITDIRQAAGHRREAFRRELWKEHTFGGGGHHI